MAAETELYFGVISRQTIVFSGSAAFFGLVCLVSFIKSLKIMLQITQVWKEHWLLSLHTVKVSGYCTVCRVLFSMGLGWSAVLYQTKCFVNICYLSRCVTYHISVGRLGGGVALSVHINVAFYDKATSIFKTLSRNDMRFHYNLTEGSCTAVILFASGAMRGRYLPLTEPCHHSQWISSSAVTSQSPDWLKNVVIYKQRGRGAQHQCLKTNKKVQVPRTPYWTQLFISRQRQKVLLKFCYCNSWVEPPQLACLWLFTACLGTTNPSTMEKPN